MKSNADFSCQAIGARSRDRIVFSLMWLMFWAVLRPAIGVAVETRTVLATFAGHPITDSEVVVGAEERHLLRPQPFTDTVMIRELVDDVIIDSLISREYPKVSLAGEYVFWAEVRRSMTTAAALYYQQDVLSPKLKLDSTQIKAFYQSHLARYMVPHEQRFVRNITIYYPMEKIPKIYNSQRDSLYDGWDPQTVIEALYARLADGEDFAELARAHSEEPKTKGYGGNIGWVSKESLPNDEFGEMCMKVPLYQISKPFRTRLGWHIVQATSIRGPGPAAIDSAITQDITTLLRDSIGAKLGKEIMDSLTAAGTIEIFDQTLQQPESNWRPNTPLAIANRRDTILAAEYQDNVERIRARMRPVPVTLEEKRKILQGMLPGLCMYNAMRQLGYLNMGEVLAQRDKLVRTRAEASLLAQLTDANFTPDSASVLRYFHEHAAEFARPQSYMVFYLRLPDQDKAQSIASTWKTGAAPDSVESRWVEKSDVPDAVWSTITKMPLGTVSDALEGGGEYWVITPTQKSEPPSLVTAAPGIRAKLQNAHNSKVQEAWIQKTGARYGIARYPGRYSRVTLPSSKGRKPLPKPESNAASMPGY